MDCTEAYKEHIMYAKLKAVESTLHEKKDSYWRTSRPSQPVRG